MRKEYCSLILCLFLLTSCVQQPVSGPSMASSVSSDVKTSSSVSGDLALIEQEYDYKVEDGSITIVKYNGTAENVVIPNAINGFPVKVIGDSAFEENKTLKSVSIPDGVVSIQKSAFKYCWNLANIKMSKNIEQIGEGAFESCAITNINLGNHLKSIGEYAFISCNNLKTVTISDGVTIGDGAFAESGIEKFRFPSDMKTVPPYTFENAFSLKEVILPPHCETIGAGAFRANCKLSEILIPDSVNDISPYAFDECSGEMVLLYDNNQLVAKYAQEHNILCFKRSEYNSVLTVELVGGKPLNDVQNLGINQEIYNIVKRSSPNRFAIKDKNDYYGLAFDHYIYNGYISFDEGDNLSDEAVKQKLNKIAALLYQCGIAEFDPKTVNTGELGCFDKLVIAATCFRSPEESKNDVINGSDVRYMTDDILYCETTGLFDVIPETSLVTGYSEQQHGIWYYPIELPKVTTEVLSFSGNLKDGNFILKVKFTDESGATCEKTFSYSLVQYDSVGGSNYRIVLKGIQ